MDTYEKAVESVSQRIKNMTRVEIKSLEEACREAATGSVVEPGEISEKDLNDVLTRFIDEETKIALIKAGYTVPGSVEEKRLLMELFFDATLRAEVLPHQIKKEIMECLAGTSEAEVRATNAQKTTRIINETIDDDVKIAGLKSKTELTDASVRHSEGQVAAMQRISELEDKISELTAQRNYTEQRDYRNDRKAAEQARQADVAQAQEEMKMWVYNLCLELYQNEVKYTQSIYDQVGWTEKVKVFIRYNANKALQNLGFDPLFPDTAEDVDPIVMNGISTGTSNHDFFSQVGNGYLLGEVEAMEDEDYSKWL